MVSGLLKTSFASFDTNQLGNWCREKYSTDVDACRRSARFEASLANAGIIPLLTWHHFEELLAIENPDIAASRVTFLSNLPFVAWIASASDEMTLGGIVDILAAELRVALTNAPATLQATRDIVVQSLIRVGSGREAMAPLVGIWRELQPFLWRRAEKNRAHVAIVESKTFDISGEKVIDLLNGRVRSGQSLVSHLHTMQASLAEDIQQHGDKRISDPNRIADRFMRGVVDIATPRPSDARELVLRGLALMDIEEGDIGPDTTLSEIDALSVFRKHARVAARIAGLDEENARRARMDVIPSWRIDQALATHKQDQAERKGSDLTDRYLAAVAPYADITFVDKRTMETFRRVFAKSKEVAGLVRDVRRATNYFDSLGTSGGQATEYEANGM